MPGTGLKVVWYAGAVLWVLKPTLVFSLAPAEKLLWKVFMMNDPVAETDRCFPCLTNLYMFSMIKVTIKLKKSNR